MGALHDGRSGGARSVANDQRHTGGQAGTTRMLVAWCEMRVDFRSFRTDRVAGAEFLDDRYPERPAVLRAKWRRSMEAELRQIFLDSMTLW